MEENNFDAVAPSNKQGNTRVGILIGVLIMLVICLGGYFVYNEFIKKDNNNKNNNQSVENNNKQNDNNSESQNDAISYNNFSYENYKFALINKIKNVDNIYAIDVKSDVREQTSFDIYVRYTDESSIKIATIQTSVSSIFEYRSLDVENNKLYFIIRSRDDNSKIFELNYIDFNNLTVGAKKLDDFNQVFIRDNLWELGVPVKTTVYSSQIFVKNNDIYYTSLKNKTLKKYNLQTKQETTIINDISWSDYFIDTANGKIFYLNNNKLYLSDLDGKNSIELENLYTSSFFWTKAIYNGKPLFEVPITMKLDDYNDVDLYIYDYNSKSFKKIKENIYGNYTVKFNSIEVNSNSIDENLLIRSFFVNNK